MIGNKDDMRPSEHSGTTAMTAKIWQYLGCDAAANVDGGIYLCSFAILSVSN